jgi:hypothetical protein
MRHLMTDHLAADGGVTHAGSERAELMESWILAPSPKKQMK